MGEGQHIILIEEPGLYEISYSFGFSASMYGESCFEAYVALNEAEAIPGGNASIHTAGVPSYSQNDKWISNHFFASLKSGDRVSLMAKTVGPYRIQAHFSMPRLTVKRISGPS